MCDHEGKGKPRIVNCQYHPEASVVRIPIPRPLPGSDKLVANIFAYVGGNPLSWSDPIGLIAGVDDVVIGGGVLAIGCALNQSCSAAVRNAVSSTVNAIGDLCKSKEDDDQCDIILDRGQLRTAGIRGCEHEIKADELGTNKNLSKFDLCGCKDGRVVVKAHGCKGPIISVTNYRWK